MRIVGYAIARFAKTQSNPTSPSLVFVRRHLCNVAWNAVPIKFDKVESAGYLHEREHLTNAATTRLRFLSKLCAKFSHYHGFRLRRRRGLGVPCTFRTAGRSSVALLQVELTPTLPTPLTGRPGGQPEAGLVSTSAAHLSQDASSGALFCISAESAGRTRNAESAGREALRSGQREKL